ncbi:MAG: sulfur carrier protein ThiS [Myxococcaceae bacterium]|nr:sulfur carrier protein ThiS [Myxococcaceae bacterium]
MRVQVNGGPRELPDGATVSHLLTLLHIDAAEVAVEVNAQVVRRTRHAEQTLRDGDQVEIVTFVGGG